MIDYSKHGEGNTIVLLHGFCENSTCFNKQVFFLQQHFQLITPDLPGFGFSEVLDNTSMEKMADEVYEVLIKEKINQCLLIGHSMGGYVTLSFAKKYSHMLNGFGLIHSTAYADSEERKEKRDQAIRVIEEKGAEPYVRNFIPPLFSKSFTDEKIIKELVEEGLRTSSEGLTQALLAMKNREDSTTFLKETTLPVLFCVGKNDTLIPEKDMFYQASLCKQSEIIYLEQSAHMGYLEEAEKCANAIKDFANDCISKN
jgi:pimeloyl-ACP methyl ester carboxylesterase